PLVQVARFRDRQFVTSSGVAFIANIAFVCVMFFMTLYLQQVRGLTPSEAGLVFLALSAALVVGSPIAGRLVVRAGGAPVMAAGRALITASFVILGVVGIATGVAVVVSGLVLSGLGQAFVFDASNTTALDAIDDSQAGAAAGLVSGARQAGSLLGLAVAGSVFRLLEQSAPAGASADRAFLDALEPTMLGVAVCCAAGVVVAMLGRARPSRGPAHPAD
ncbi:MAG TPA: MFS transporter, partial [Acidimicrobiia bacterium]|nr:MFS transporter [Acidimicrobiia bacterium]